MHYPDLLRVIMVLHSIAGFADDHYFLQSLLLLLLLFFYKRERAQHQVYVEDRESIRAYQMLENSMIPFA